VIFDNDTAICDFVGVHDASDMVMLDNDAAIGKVFNCGTGHSALSTTDFLRSLAQTLLATPFRTIQ
jgi:hypothetical protein